MKRSASVLLKRPAVRNIFSFIRLKSVEKLSEISVAKVATKKPMRVAEMHKNTPATNKNLFTFDLGVSTKFIIEFSIKIAPVSTHVTG